MTTQLLTQALPPLPEFTGWIGTSDQDPDAGEIGFSAEQMREYAQAAIRAHREANNEATAEKPEPVSRVLPHPGTLEASDRLNAILAEYNHPTNPKNAARAGWEAANRWLAAAPTQPAPQPLSAETIRLAKVALHEMPKPSTDWHEAAKRVCTAVALSGITASK
jgi:hypothetical protein